ncbi:MAG TPA: MmgE/PrpD family protein [Candidatus Dormibacteraeota bacterium]
MITEALAEFIARTRFADLPEVAVTAAKRLWLDSIGVAMAGSAEPLSAAITSYIREQAGPPQVSVIGQGFRTSPALAALANGTMAHALDYDDISITWLGHPSAILVAAVLATGTRLEVSGQSALTGYVVGWEVGASIGRSIRHRIHEAGWHSTSVTGTIAAAAACANLAGLNADRTRTALGIAASMTSGMYLNRGTDTKPVHAGIAARNGMMAADLAARGVSAAADIFEGPGNF